MACELGKRNGQRLQVEVSSLLPFVRLSHRSSLDGKGLRLVYGGVCFGSIFIHWLGCSQAMSGRGGGWRLGPGGSDDSFERCDESDHVAP